MQDIHKIDWNAVPAKTVPGIHLDAFQSRPRVAEAAGGGRTSQRRGANNRRSSTSCGR